MSGSVNEFIDREIPHLEGLTAPSPEAAMQDAEFIVVGHAGSDEMAAIRKRYDGQQIIDLAGVDLLQQLGGRSYHGICW
jgi:GDP-mannose 6-dehydrogenase